MSNFLIAYNRTAVFEGGYSNDPDDNGNWTGGIKGKGILVGTNYGITAPELFRYMGHIPSVLDMKNLSKDVVEKIYKSRYWDMVRGDEINNQEAANDIYDMAINAGVGTAIILAHRAENLPDSTIMTDDLINKINNATGVSTVAPAPVQPHTLERDFVLTKNGKTVTVKIILSSNDHPSINITPAADNVSVLVL